MSRIKAIIQLIILLLLQVLLISNLQLGGICQPYIYILFLLVIPPLKSRWLMMFIGAALGLLMDIFYNSLGIHMAACVLTMFLRGPMIQNFVLDYDRLNNSIGQHSIGTEAFIKYATTLIFIHHTVVIFLTAWSFQHILWTLLTIVVSSVFCLLLTLGYDFIKK